MTLVVAAWGSAGFGAGLSILITLSGWEADRISLSGPSIFYRRSRDSLFFHFAPLIQESASLRAGSGPRKEQSQIRHRSTSRPGVLKRRGWSDLKGAIQRRIGSRKSRGSILPRALSAGFTHF